MKSDPIPVPVVVISNLLVLIAWFAILRLSGQTGVLVLALVYAALLAGEFMLPALDVRLGYYRGLRIILTVIVILCHLAMAALA